MPSQFQTEHKQRHSLQPTSTTELPLNLRHTQSHRYKNKKIKEEEDAMSDNIVTISELGEISSEEPSHRTGSFSDAKKKPKVTSKPEMFAIQNPAFAFDSADRYSLASKAGSTRMSSTRSSRPPSVQSLGVVREQYCCCAKRTRCERRLIIAVAVLGLVIVVLTIVIVLIATKDQISSRIGIAGAFRR